jgi:hypothetical protein
MPIRSDLRTKNGTGLGLTSWNGKWMQKPETMKNIITAATPSNAIPSKA